MISCLTVTQPEHFHSLEFAVYDFSRQTHRDRELVIVHDGPPEFHKRIVGISEKYAHCKISVTRCDQRKVLGELRNISVDLAGGEVICQWDDDDRYHSKRLEVQYKNFTSETNDFCFFTDQLHLFTQSGELFWDDWDVETYPMNLIQGTIMGFKDKMPLYPALQKGEDTPLVTKLVNSGYRIFQLKNHGFLYIYVFNGKNTWDFDHHGAISAWKRFRRDRLEENLSTIELALKDYGLESHILKLPCDDGVIELNSH